jgi:hypothetical protein
MIIETPDETNPDVVRTTWKFPNDEQEYSTMWDVCANPFCGCSGMTFGIGLGQGTEAVASFKFDVVEKRVTETGSDGSGGILSGRLGSELSPEDKDILVRIFRSGKIECEEECDLEKIDPPEFPAAKIESESLMIDYKSVFPWAEEHWFSTSDATYHVIDQYCLNSTCNCQNSSLDFVGIRDGVPFNDGDPTLVTYNCASGKWEAAETGKKAHTPPVLMRELSGKYPDFRNVLRKRRAKLKLLYKRYREKIGLEAIPADTAHIKQAAGRNDPCPCGSGKKFKKCCGS